MILLCNGFSVGMPAKRHWEGDTLSFETAAEISSRETDLIILLTSD
jgi:hypothetical protein